MKQLSSLFRRAAALTLAVALAFPLTARAAAPQNVLETGQFVLDGLTYNNTIATTTSGRLESFSAELDPFSSLQPILLQGTDTVCGGATIDQAVARAQDMGYRVYAAINADYFDTATGIPLGIVIENGVYKCSSATATSALVIGENGVSLCDAPEVSMTLTSLTTGNVVIPHHFNRLRVPTGGAYLLNADFSADTTRTSTSGWFVRFRLTEHADLGVSSALTMQVTEVLRSDQPLTIGEDEYVLTADDNSWLSEMFESFQVGDLYLLETSCTDPALASAQWAGGTGAVLVQNGAVTDKSTWLYADTTRAPRSALGMRADGTLLLYAADGRQSSYSVGLTLDDLADELLARGCEWAVNLDGGGSTALSVWIPGKTGADVQNSPSAGSLRACASYLMLVGDEQGDGLPHALAPTETGLCVLAGSSVTLPDAVIVDNALTPLGIERDTLSFYSAFGLGSIRDGVYTAGMDTGSDILILHSERLDVSGTMQLHVVDTLSSLQIHAGDSAANLSSLSLNPGDTVQLSVTGTYFGREALRSTEGVTFTVSEQLGTVDETGLLTISPTAAAGGELTVSVGGLTKTIPIQLLSAHLDVPGDHWAFSAVDFCYRNGIVNGISPSEFGPNYLIRRADFVLMLYNALGKPTVSTPCTFTDVAETDYFYTAMAWAQEQGLVNGVGNDLCLPNDPITREQAFTVLHKALPLLALDCPDAPLSVLSDFSDAAQISEYALTHTATLVAQGIVNGTNGVLNPKGNLTRAEMAALVQRVMTHTPVTDYPTEEPGDLPEEPDAPDDALQGGTLSLDFSELTVWSSETYPLTATLSPAVEDAQIIWTSSDPTVAAVSPTGEVTNLYTGLGTQTVTITASYGELSASCLVTCPQAGLTGVVYNVANSLNIRSGPDSSYAVQGSLRPGDVVIVLNHVNDWYEILYPDQTQACIGYVNAKYMLLNLY